jgi:hypothetical protein
MDEEGDEEEEEEEDGEEGQHTKVSTVAILGKVCIQRDAVLRDHAQLRRKPIEFVPDLLKLIEHLAMLLPQLLTPTLMITVNLPQRFQLELTREKKKINSQLFLIAYSLREDALLAKRR